MPDELDHIEQTELAELRRLERHLRDVPREALLSGQPHDAELLLQRTRRAVRTES